jgi:hypothetical protein
MRALLPTCPAVLAGLFALSLPASAKVAAPAPLPTRVAHADLVVLGKVTAVEPKTVTLKDGSEYKVAVVKIDEALVGGAGLTHVRVGFIPGGFRRFPASNLTVGQEACFFLSSLPGATFSVPRMYYDVIAREGNPEFAGELAVVRRCGRLLRDPAAGLRSKEADDRLLTAALLVGRYRRPCYGPTRAEPIDAAQSRLILEALADADWTRRDPQTSVTAPDTFFRLGLTKQDGWEHTPGGDVAAAARKWLRDHAATYRIQKIVPAKAAP